ncbi:hypothetical protein V2J09_018922 [Rumex salicifolius]
MKGINISCSSHSSTAIYTPISMDQASSSTSSSSSALFPVILLGGSGGGGGGGRAIDRHNPIITDERRVSRSTPTSSAHSTPFFTPKNSPFIQPKKTPQKTNSKPKKNSSTTNAKRLIGLRPKIKSNGDSVHDDHHQQHEIHALKKDESQPSDLYTIKGPSKAASTVDHISPKESSRYLLGDPGREFGSGFFDRALSDFDPVLKLQAPFEQPKPEISSSTGNDELVPAPKLKTSNSAKPPLPPTSNPDNQVVVLRVSLHCRGCEGKGFIPFIGVRSFTIDFAAKKVTVVGDVTPLEVLASISKVKNAQIWTPPPSSSSSKSMDPFTHKKV